MNFILIVYLTQFIMIEVRCIYLIFNKKDIYAGWFKTLEIANYFQK